jgi:adenosylhomocysteine nucleosidase
MIGIIGAMQVEIDGIREKMTEISEQTVSGVTYTKGRVGKTEVVTAVCGVGKVFAAICAQTMILRYNVSAVINTGIGGTLSPEIGILDLAISSGVVEHDMDTSAVGDPVGMISGINMIDLPADPHLYALAERTAGELGIRFQTGIIASGDQFVADRARKDFIHETFHAIACEMEGAAVGHVCCVNQVPFVILRAISDDVSGGGPADYNAFKMKAAAVSNRMTLALLAAGKVKESPGHGKIPRPSVYKSTRLE